MEMFRMAEMTFSIKKKTKKRKTKQYGLTNL